MIRPAEEVHTGETGLYGGVPDAIYFDLPRMSNSGLKGLDGQPEASYGASPSASQSFGTMAHSFFLTPLEFMGAYGITTRCRARTQAGHQCKHWGKNRVDGKWYCRVHTDPEASCDDLLPLRQRDLEQLQTWQEMMQGDPDISRLRGAPGVAEVVVLWTDPDTLLPCKGKIDFLSITDGIAYDLKTSREGGADAFPYHLERYKYHRQEAFYRAGLRAVGLPPLKRFAFIALGKDDRVSVHDLPPEVLRYGQEEIRALMVRAKKSTLEPDYSPAEPVYSTPGWGAEMAQKNADGFTWGFVPES